MRKKRFEQSLRFKFFSLISGILIVSSLILTTAIAWKLQAELHESLKSKGRGIASYIAKLSLDPLIAKDSLQLDVLVNEANKDEDILYAVISDAGQNPVTSQYASVNYRSQRVKPILSGLAKDRELQDIVTAIRNDGKLTEVALPVVTGEDVIGKVTVGLSEARVHAEIVEAVLFIVALNLTGAIALGAVLFIASKRWILDPVTGLAQATARIATGDLSIRVQTRASGEMGQLVESFNRMAADLSGTTVSKEALEEKAAELARSNAELEQFAYVASHDLQEPLRMVASFVQLLEHRYKGKLDEEAGEFIAFAVEGATRMKKLINDLLALSRVGAGDRELRSVEAEAALEQAMGSLKETIEANGAVITHDPLPAVVANATELAGLFARLIDNAIKFRGPEPPCIHVGVERMNGEVHISVRDNGMGIAPEHFDKIFRLFQRLNSRERYPGTGIGLAECKKIVERVGGRIWVESQPGEGATFHFTVPRERRREERQNPSPE
jgi:signal transduction histidine kinase